MARFQTRPTSSLFPPPHGPFGSNRHLSPSWTARPPIGCSRSAPPAIGCAPCTAPPQLLSDWLTRERLRQGRGTARHSRTAAGSGGPRLEDPAERWRAGTKAAAKAARSGSGSFPSHCCCCCCRVIYTRLSMDKITLPFVPTT